ncbi:MAG TPA: DUF6468 domain-containing protein [Caulobacteraceae bacterium]|jgi:hypothetical protein|nr:DUF6468 domain-containing protein [Caulobacteraceae bacterium]
MSDIGLIMNVLLGVLLVGALFLGWRLEGRLKALRASHQSFTQAVGDLDRAAQRAEQGLADLRAATDEAAETLAARIDRAGHLAGRLEKLTADAEGAHMRLAHAPRLQTLDSPRREPARHEAPLRESARHEAPRYEQPQGRPAAQSVERQPQSRDTSFVRFAERHGAAGSGAAPSPLAEAAARNDLILEDDERPAARAAAAPAVRLSPAAAARLERLQALARPRSAPSRAVQGDDELFETPRRAAGGLR